MIGKKRRYIDMVDLPDDVFASALKFEQYAACHGPQIVGKRGSISHLRSASRRSTWS